MAYERSAEADSDLKEIYKYSYLTFGQAQADRYYDGLIERFGKLADSPMIARERTEFSPPVRIHPNGQHLIVYRTQGPAILVIRVLHQAMDIDSAL